MFPVRMSSVFKSRWKALLWAAGIIWIAYDIGGSMPGSDDNSAKSEQAADANGTVTQKIPATWN